MSGIFLVTHPSKQQASECSRQPTKMDINVLEEQYHCLKQKQKLQTHVIVFKTDDAETVPGESMINAVLINKKFRKGKVLTEHIPTRKVNLDLPCGRNVQESSPWRIHLGIHRLVQGEHLKTPCDVGRNNNEKISKDSKKLLEEESVISHGELLTGSEQSIELLGKQGNSSPLEKTGSSSSSLTSVTSLVWTRSQISASKFAPSASKLTYYPFPQKKTPRISEAARKLGLYVP